MLFGASTVLPPPYNTIQTEAYLMIFIWGWGCRLNKGRKNANKAPLGHEKKLFGMSLNFLEFSLTKKRKKIFCFKLLKTHVFRS